MCWGNLPAQLSVQAACGYGCQQDSAAITETHVGEELVKAILDPYNMEGSSIHVNFTTSNPGVMKPVSINAMSIM